MREEGFDTKLIAVTTGAGELVNKTAQEVISYITRVSNPKNQKNFDTASKLLAYCIKHKHWSPFEHAYMTIEIQTSRAIAQQILRHRSFTFQEFSQRYAIASEQIMYRARRQDDKNRQNSVDDLSEEDRQWFIDAQGDIADQADRMYQIALRKGIAKECARFMLPLNTETKLYMTGPVRSWIHYIELRISPSTQKEHRDIALGCRDIFVEQFSDVAEALEWTTQK